MKEDADKRNSAVGKRSDRIAVFLQNTSTNSAKNKPGKDIHHWSNLAKHPNVYQRQHLEHHSYGEPKDTIISPWE